MVKLLVVKELGKTRSKIRRKERLWKRYCATRDGTVHIEYRRLCNQIRNLTRKMRKNVEKNVAKESKQNPKKFWQFVSKNTKNKVAIPDLYCDESCEIITDGDNEKASVLNKQFVSVFTEENNLPNFEIPDKTDQKIPDLIVNKELVLKKLKKLKISKSPGPDEIHPRVLKEIATIICHPLVIIYQKSLDTGELPTDWRLGNITAIYKKGSKKVAGNYRPVSLTSIACKIIESIIRDHVIEFMKDNKLFSDKQFGFIGGRSTVLQLLRLLDQITTIIDSGGAVDIVYFYFAKAFDRVPHKRLNIKLASHGIAGNILEWIKAFLSDRKQRVCVNGSFSEWVDVTSGVPQGSVLGPLLFVIFINDLPDTCGYGSVMYLFADDTKLFRKICTMLDVREIQLTIDRMKAWSEVWLMDYHPDKCKVLQLGKNSLKGSYDYNLAGHQLESVDSEKDLGVTFDTALSFDKHMSEKIKKANSILGVVRRTFQFLDRESFLVLYKSLVRPQIEYANQVWAPRLKRQIDSIENVQKRATRLIPGLKGLSYEERLRALKLPTLSYRRLRGDLQNIDS